MTLKQYILAQFGLIVLCLLLSIFIITAIKISFDDINSTRKIKTMDLICTASTTLSIYLICYDSLLE